jgi:hypothetical protein
MFTALLLLLLLLLRCCSSQVSCCCGAGPELCVIAVQQLTHLIRVEACAEDLFQRDLQGHRGTTH